jgi:hypothetical protein
MQHLKFIKKYPIEKVGRKKLNSISFQIREQFFKLSSELKIKYERKKNNMRQNKYCFICTHNVNGEKGKKGSGLWKGEVICVQCVVYFFS